MGRRPPRRPAGPALDPDTWVAPALPTRGDTADVAGALYGSRLYDQPAHQDAAAAVRAFCAPGPPLNVEIGVDRGYRLLAHARRWPAARWLGLEIRRSILDATPMAPENALLFRGDARAVLAALVPAGRVGRIDALFPSPSDDPRKLLLTPTFAALCARVLAPSGVVHVATDVPGMVPLAEAAFAEWTAAAHPPSGPVQSRREKVCAAEGRPVWRWTWRAPGEGRP